MKKKQETPRENGMKDLSLFPNPRRRNLFPRRSWLAAILKTQLAVEVFPKKKKSFPEEEPVSDPELSETSVPKKKRKFSSMEETFKQGGAFRVCWQQEKQL